MTANNKMEQGHPCSIFHLLKLFPVSIIFLNDWVLRQKSLPDQLVPGNRVIQGFLLLFFCIHKASPLLLSYFIFYPKPTKKPPEA